MKRLFLHIGFPKTGSTSLQKNLGLNSASLAAQGICYPYAPEGSYGQRWAHAPLVAAMPNQVLDWLAPRKRAKLDQAYDEMFAAFDQSGCPTLVISSEGYGGIEVGKKKLLWLKEKFSDFDTTIIAYIRRQDAYLLSTYQESVKGGSSAPFDFESLKNSKRLNFARRLAPWRDVFGQDRVVVRPFLPSVWPEGELLFDFLPLIGAGRDGIQLADPENEGLDYRTVEILRQLNACNVQAGTRHVGLRRVANDADAFFSAEGGKRKMQLSGQQCEILRRHFREDNRLALAGSGVDVDTFFPSVPDNQAERLVPDSLDPDLLIKLLWSLAPAAAAGRKPMGQKGGGKKQGQSRS
jgi:hypothetical protein